MPTFTGDRFVGIFPENRWLISWIIRPICRWILTYFDMFHPCHQPDNTPFGVIRPLIPRNGGAGRVP